VSDDAGLRASDEQRDRAAAEIREHFAAGRLDDDELAERLEAVYRARTQGELRAVRADLPALPVAARTQARAELAERRSRLRRQMIQQSGGGLGAFVLDEEVVPVLRVEDAARAVAWYRRLGFVKEWEHQFEPGFPWFVSVARGNVRVYLSEHTGDARPDTLIHLYVKDIDAVSEQFGIPVDEDGLAGRECDLVDPDGNRLRVATRRS
jgi:catechol 2,3-dioxygenase-like lactoylglutathione lyase family enzyme